jgi:hypothetical protein
MVSMFIGDIHAQDSAKLVPRLKSKGEYIILKDSTKLTGNVWRSGNGVKLDGKFYGYDQLLGYKENTGYKAIFDNGVYDVWSVGKIQAYSHWMTTGTGVDYNPHAATPQGKWTTSDRHTNFCYLKKANGQLVAYTSQNLQSLISDNEAAVTEFNKFYKKINQNNPLDPFYEHLKKVLAVYNGGEYTEY